MTNYSSNIKQSLIEDELTCFDIDKISTGVEFHYSDLIEKSDQWVTSKREPGITLGILIEGRLDFVLDSQSVQIEVPHKSPALCFAYNLAKPATWRRRLIKENQVKKLTFTLPHQWINQRLGGNSTAEEVLVRLLQSHAEVFKSTAKKEILQLTDNFFAESEHKNSRIEMESLSLQFILSNLTELADNLPKKLPMCEFQVSRKSKMAANIKSHIEKYDLYCDASERLALSNIAMNLGASVSTLQRKFSQEFNLTIGEFTRIRRLEIAKERIESGYSIGEVAYQAGYKHTSNFSSAFRKQFGETPGRICSEQLRNRN